MVPARVNVFAADVLFEMSGAGDTTRQTRCLLFYQYLTVKYDEVLK